MVINHCHSIKKEIATSICISEEEIEKRKRKPCAYDDFCCIV